MSFFAIRYPFFVLMACMIVVVVGVAAMTGMPVDLFPPVKIPVVVVATFYSGMPPQQIESDITNSDERFFTLGSNIDHIESRSMSSREPIPPPQSAASPTLQWRTSAVCRLARCRP
jgi:multidrug efflux pump subunit AcrB